MRPLLVLLHAMPYYLRNKQGNILGGIKCVYRDDLVLGLISLHPVFSVCKVPSVPELDPGRCQRRPTRRAAEFCGRWPENRLDCPAEEQNRQGKRLSFGAISTLPPAREKIDANAAFEWQSVAPVWSLHPGGPPSELFYCCTFHISPRVLLYC
jgi:hypothetical protein